MLEVKGEQYRIWHDEVTSTLCLEGKMYLNGEAELKPICRLLEDVQGMNASSLILDINPLTFICSSGLNVLYKFVIAMNAKATMNLQVRGSDSVVWQQTALPNIKKLMPSVKLEFAP